jgi:hypothetical protein
MTALTHSGVLPPSTSLRARFARALTVLKMVFEAFAEAQDMARAAHRTRPFIDWS